MTFIRSHKKGLTLLAVALVTCGTTSSAFSASWFSGFPSILPTVKSLPSALWRAATHISSTVAQSAMEVGRNYPKTTIALLTCGIFFASALSDEAVMAEANHRRMVRRANKGDQERFRAIRKSADEKTMNAITKQMNIEMMQLEYNKYQKPKNEVAQAKKAAKQKEEEALAAEYTEKLALTAIDVTVEDAAAAQERATRAAKKKAALDELNKKSAQITLIEEQIANPKNAQIKENLLAQKSAIEAELYELTKKACAL